MALCKPGGEVPVIRGSPAAPREVMKGHSLNSPQGRAGLPHEGLGPEVVLRHDDQGQVAGGQGA